MAPNIGMKALQPNRALKPFQVFVGEWDITASHPLLPGAVLRGRASFEWLAGGAFLIMRSEIDEPHVPHGVAIFGSDDAARKFSMIYFDERGVSRIYEVAMVGNELRWWRNQPSFSQRFVMTIEADGSRMTAKGEMSRDGGPWEEDLEEIFTRIK